MKFVTFSHKQAGHRQHAGILDDEQVACLTEAGLAASVLEVVQGGGAALEKVRSGLAKAPRYALADIILEAPSRPGKVLCSGINY
ncbi:FAA hydrolase family protein, partial [Mesorhizobium sp. M1A.F.Ca.ET.072.01.1.1]